MWLIRKQGLTFKQLVVSVYLAYGLFNLLQYGQRLGPQDRGVITRVKLIRARGYQNYRV